MLLYCNGDHHVTGAMAVNNHVTAKTDPQFQHLGDSPHPENLKVCWPRKLADPLKAGLHFGYTSDVVKHLVEDASDWISSLNEGLRTDAFVVIQWPISAPSDHDRVWKLHNHLSSLKVKHLFYNSTKAFFRVKRHYDWGVNFIEPYNKTRSYISTLEGQGFQTVTPNSPYFGKDGHSFWARFLLQYMINQGLV